MTTLKELLRKEISKTGDYTTDLEAILIGPSGLGDDHPPSFVEFDDLEEYDGDTGYGFEELPGIIAWSENCVYYKVKYDGSEWVDSVPRHPTDSADTSSSGGG